VIIEKNRVYRGFTVTFLINNIFIREMKKQVIEVEGAYFEYSLSGSSKALAN